MYICDFCKNLVRDEDVRSTKELRGNIGEFEYMQDACYCGGNLEPAHFCVKCGEWFCDNDMMSNKICNECGEVD